MLCRIYNKKGTLEKHYNVDQKEVQFSDSEDQKPNVDAMPFSVMAPVAQNPQGTNEYMHFDSSDSVPKLHTDSSSSEHVLSSSTEFMCDKEVQSEPKWNELENYLDFDAAQDNPFSSQVQYNDLFSAFPDMFAFMQKPF